MGGRLSVASRLPLGGVEAPRQRAGWSWSASQLGARREREGHLAEGVHWLGGQPLGRLSSG